MTDPLATGPTSNWPRGAPDPVSIPGAIAGDPVRATTWNDYIGQPKLKKRLDVHIRAALAENRPLEHVLLTGPPGMGKTTIANIIAARLGDPFHVLSMPMKPAALASFFMEIEEEGGVVFMDEVHRASKSHQEDLLTLLEDGYLSNSSGRRIEAPWLTVIGATTEPENVLPPLYSRFPIVPRVEEYTLDEMERIITGMAAKLKVDLEEEAGALARAAGGVPRAARQLVLAARALAITTQQDNGVAPTAAGVLAFCEIDPSGLTQNHLLYIDCLRKLGGKAGLAVIATMMRLHESVVRELERLLIGRELLTYGEKGRELTTKGRAYGNPPASPSARRR